MENKQMNAVRVKFSFKEADGQWMETESNVPLYVAKFLSCELIDWENRWTFTPSDHNIFLKSNEVLKTNI